MNRLHILWTVLAILSTFTVNAQDFLYQGLAFNFIPDNSGVELVALPDGKKYEGIVRIPSLVNLYNAKLLQGIDYSEVKRREGPFGSFAVVSRIGDRAFKDCKKLISLDMSEMSDFDIGTEAVKGCTSLLEIILPDLGRRWRQVRIGDRAFMNSSCKRLYIPEDVTEIGANAFRDCKRLKYLTLPATLCHVRENAFSGVSLDDIAFSNFDNMKRPPRYSFSSICGRHIPDLIVFPTAKEKEYREWYPKMFKKKIPVLLAGEGSIHLSNKLIDLETGRVYPRSILLQNVRKDFDANATVLVNKGSNLSIISIIKSHDGRSQTAMVNDRPMKLEYQNFRIKAYREKAGYIEEWIVPYNIYMLELEDIKSPITVNLDCE